ncbi:alpha/beta-hydrolase [Hysterangium stoloniferum]|nr:alpha/beta-hydrolase [Hysterangium stoloniferum]
MKRSMQGVLAAFAMVILSILGSRAGPVVESDISPAVHTEFKSSLIPNTGLRFVENSGVCETTPGVHTVSGYIDIAPNQSLWFWFFAARENPDTAPFTLWLNGGPGCSSMIGLFQENGPCQVNADGQTTTLNPFSWNNVSNMIYIDQPVGTGFSFGIDTINSTQAAAPPVWTAFQLLFESPTFSQYKSREFIFATESYGGHYGPAFVTFFDQQNAKIQAGQIQGELVTVSALMINNGWFDPLLQYRSYIDFAADAPGYGPLVDASVIEQLNTTWFSANGCLAEELKCYAAGTDSKSNTICKKTDNDCFEQTFVPILGDRDDDDLRQTAPAAFPPEFYVNFLQLPAIKAKIGATSTYAECPDAPFELFAKTGDDARTLLPQLSALVNSKLKVLIWAGDADINCNWLGGHSVVLAMDWYGNATLHNTPLTNITINGSPVAAVQNVDNFSFARVYQAGHEVPAFQPQAAFEIFKQVIAKEQLHSV